METLIIENLQAFISRGNVLIVEDSSYNSPILSMILKQNGHNVRNVLSSELELQSIKKNPPHIILLDINIFDFHVYQICEIIKVDEQLKEIPIIFINVYYELIDKINVFDIGGVDYITIPYNDKEVLTRIETHLRLQFIID